MKIYRKYSDFKGLKPVVTLGMFDGVHKGHRTLLEAVAKRADETGGKAIVLTFEPHPGIILSKRENGLNFLTSLDEKINLLEEAGIKHLIVLEFTKALSRMSACDFVKEILIDGIGISHLIIGFDHSFGHKGEGSGETIKECAYKYSFSVERIEAFVFNNSVVSSTNIRKMLSGGDLDGANSMLGYDYFLKGTVIEGDKLGRSMGYPTANLKPDYPYKLIPRDGVYAVDVQVRGKLYKSMLYIGRRPTVAEGQGERTIEANIFDFEGDLYGGSITVYFRHRLRDDIKFDNRELLREQIEKDKEETLRILGY
ncbi:MAG: bifunctional riboflavin kinase/FAD synthetase [Bacteroidales bacterium]|nr:bifunctional riboflavin kinase/FAD synthetase [Bacteroidales bacterium]